jgi:hypothetical protein
MDASRVRGDRGGAVRLPGVAAGRYVLTDGAALLVAVGNEFVLHGHELKIAPDTLPLQAPIV